MNIQINDGINSVIIARYPNIRCVLTSIKQSAIGGTRSSSLER